MFSTAVRPTFFSFLSPAPISPFSKIVKISGQFFSTIGQFFRSVTQNALSITKELCKDFFHHPIRFSWTTLKICLGALACQWFVTNPKFTESDSLQKVINFTGGWLVTLVLNGIVQWFKEPLHIESFLAQEKKSSTRAAIAFLANLYLILKFQLPNNQQVSALFQAIYGYIQAINLHEVFMKIVDHVRTSTNSLSPVFDILEHPLKFLGECGNFAKDLVFHPIKALQDLQKNAGTLFEKLQKAIKKGSWKETIGRICAILIPAILALSIIFTGGLSSTMILIAIGLAVLSAYLLTKKCDEIWPED